MPSREEDWSDSDDENLSEIETSVLLGVPDGAIDTASDLSDAAVSRIGGRPAFLPSREPSFTSSQCKVCSNPAELLVQMWCPFEDSPMDRSLYVWGCSKPSCQGKPGSIRAWRGLRRNDKYAAKLEKKLAKKREAEEAKARAAAAKQAAEQKAKTAAKVNPFSMKSTPAVGTFGGFGNQIFGSEPENLTAAPTTKNSSESPAITEKDTESNDDGASESSEEDEELLTALASVTLEEESPWMAAPAYTPLYLSTVSEYLPPESKPKVPAGAETPDADDNDSKGKGANAWASEAYENSLEVDHVFERFTKRVSCEGEQCVRYELNGTPLPYSSDSIFTSLFPSPPSTTPAVTHVTKAAFHPPLPKRSYFPTSTTITNCPACRSKRVFECQLMPNLINVLRKGDTGDKDATATGGGKVGLSDEDRRKAVERALKGEGGAGVGMDWGTCFIFSCENDCCLDDVKKQEARECWREELVMIQSAL